MLGYPGSPPGGGPTTPRTPPPPHPTRGPKSLGGGWGQDLNLNAPRVHGAASSHELDRVQSATYVHRVTEHGL